MNIQIHKLAQLTGHNASIYSLAKARKEGSFFSSGGDGWLVEWNLDNPEMGKLIAKTDNKIYTICHFEEHQLVAAGNMEGGLHWIDLEKGENLKNAAHHEQGIFSIMDWKGKYALVGGGMGRISKWDLETLQLLESFHLTNTSIRSLSHHNGNILVGASDNNIYVLDEDFEILQCMEDAHDNSVFSAISHPKGIVSGGRDAQLKLWDKEGKLLWKENAHWFTINDIQFSPDGTIFATASRDKTIRIWSTEGCSLIKELNAERDGCHLNSVNSLLWIDDVHLASASDDRSIIIWKIEHNL